MARLHKGIVRFALVRLAGTAVTLIVIAAILAALFGGSIFGFGVSASGVPVGVLIAERLTVTLPLAVIALILAIVAGVPLGAFAAARGGLLRRVIAVLADGALALPAVFAGMLLVLIFTGLLRWLPQGGFVPWAQNFGAAFTSLLLPAFALAIPLGALIARAAIRSFAGTAALPEVFAGRLVGLTLGQSVWRHGYPAAALPIIALVGRAFGLLVAGAMVVENVFYLPGLGRLLFTAVAEHDLAVIQGGLLVLIAIAAVVRLVADMALAFADARRIAGRLA